MKKVKLFTDGACSGNPGPGGWGAILRYGEREKALSGGERDTTNNRMELTAVIEGLSALREPCEVELISDSKYVTDALEKGWIWAWRRNGWRRSNNEPALNVDLWERLLPLLSTHSITCKWIRGHAGHPENERCDRMAVEWYTALRNKTIDRL
jgi:ribonuclease HI